MRDWLLVPILATYLAIVVAVSVPFDLDLWFWGGAAALYLTMATMLWAVMSAGRTIHPAIHALAAIPVGVLLAWHFREQLNRPEDGIAFGVASIAAAGGLWTSQRRLSATLVRVGPAITTTIGSVVILMGVLVGLYASSSKSRWHLLRHHRMAGIGAFYALAPAIREAHERHFAENVVVERENQAEPVEPLHEAERPQPNIIFILVDTLRADALAAYGGDASLTPRLNEFATRAVRYTDVLASSSWTRASVASFFTGLLPEHHGAINRNDTLSGAHVTLAERLSQAGYDTAAFVTNYATVGREAGFAQGFGTFKQLHGTRSYVRAEQVTAEAERWLRSRTSTQQPLFLYAHYLDPHVPYYSGGGQSPLHATARRAYNAELRYMDEHVAHLASSVRDILDGPTYVFVTSDHGEQFGEHFERGHANALYKEEVQLPALLAGPGLRTRSVREPLEARFFFDLITELASGSDFDAVAWAKEHKTTRRYSSVRFTKGGMAPHRHYLQEVSMRLLRDGTNEIIWSAYGSTWELYDLEEDPEEHDNLVMDRAKEARRMRRLLMRHLSTVKPARRPSHDHHPNADKGEAGEEELSQAAREQLRALGYAQ